MRYPITYETVQTDGKATAVYPTIEKMSPTFHLSQYLAFLRTKNDICLGFSAPPVLSVRHRYFRFLTLRRLINRPLQGFLIARLECPLHNVFCQCLLAHNRLYLEGKQNNQEEKDCVIAEQKGKNDMYDQTAVAS
jgi:hypothetical protein